MTNTAVYTAIFSDDGAYQHDSLKEDMVFEDDVDYICFTNNRYITSENWDVRYVDELKDGSGRKTARYYKIMAHRVLPRYDEWIWMDGSHKMTSTVSEFRENCVKNKHFIVAAPHPDRECIYEEAKICANRKLDDPEIIKKQMDHYKEQGYPKNQGLIESSVLYRRNDDLCMMVNEEWWSLLDKFSVRDQLSFNYVIWKLNQEGNSIYYALMDGCICLQKPSLNYSKSKHFKSTPHIHKNYPRFRKVYRISDAGYDKEKLEIDELGCLKNFINVFGTNDLYVLADNCSDETLDRLDEIDNLNWQVIHGGSSAGSFRVAVDYAFTHFNDEDIVYFIEDDYLHLQDGQRFIYEAIKEGSSYVTLYDHPDKYLNKEKGGNPYVSDGGEVTRVFTTDSSHWKLTNSTTMTFACKLKTLREDKKVWGEHISGLHPNDFEAFLDLREKGRTLASPIPGKSTHIEKRWLSPFINWKKLAEKYDEQK